ncbi:MAG: hypothetical protein GY811_22940 [Myxococcales bacterium]|nr:hypothetical protein [Myxococcales bacterium]
MFRLLTEKVTGHRSTSIAFSFVVLQRRFRAWIGKSAAGQREQTITQKTTFKGATAKDVYGIYMNSKKHAAATGAPAEMSRKAGEKFKAHKGHIRGTNLLVKANKIVVQSWRAKGWKTDSVLTLQFDDTTEGCELTMVHALVPEASVADIKSGWTKMYWKPFKTYLKANN